MQRRGNAMTPEWSDFKVLLALARGGSVAGAARELQVDNSTVSRRLAALEKTVGTTLLIRGGREFTWTAQGRTLLEAGEAMEAAVNQALLNVRTAKEDMEGTVRVSVVPAFVPLLVSKVLPELHTAHPSLKIELNGAYYSLDIAKGECDIAVRMVRPEQPDLIAKQVCDAEWAVFAARSYLETHGQPKSFDELSSHKLVLFVESMHNIPAFKWLETWREDSTHVSRVDNVEIACQSICAGGGITVLPGFIGDNSPELMRVFPASIAVATGWLVYHQAARNTARVRVVVDALIDFFQTNREMFAGAATQKAKAETGSQS